MTQKKPTKKTARTIALTLDDIDGYNLAMHRAERLNRMVLTLIDHKDDWADDGEDLWIGISELVEDISEKLAAADAIVQAAWKGGAR
jgi:hypothetical protein